MQVRPVASKSDIQHPQSNERSAKARAVAAFNNASNPPTPQVQPPQQPQAHPAQLDQNSLHAEDLGSLQIPKPNIQDKSTQDEPTQVSAETAPVEDQSPRSEPDPALSRQFAQLARQEKALRAKVQQQQQEWAKRDADLKAREAALASKAEPDLSQYIPRDRLKSDPLGVLAEAEVSYEQLTEQEIARQNIHPQLLQTINELRNEIKSLKQVNEEGKKSQVQQQQDQYQAAIKQIQMDAKALVKSDPVTYEAIYKTGTVKDVVKLIEDTYHKDGVLLSVEEAAQEVENYLVEENYKMATKIEKIRKRIGQSSAQPQTPAKTQQVKPEQTPMKTLTNATSSSRPMSARERAIAAFEGKLK